MNKQLYNLLTIIIVSFLSFQAIYGQTDDQSIKSKKYKTWVIPIDNSYTIKGYLSEIEDSHIVVSSLSNYGRRSIDISNIKELKFREKGNKGKGILYGALGGFVIGGIAGFIVGGDDENCESTLFDQCRTGTRKALAGGVLIAIPGALIGGIIGSMKISIPIYGDQATVKSKQEELLKYKLNF